MQGFRRRVAPRATDGKMRSLAARTGTTFPGADGMMFGDFFKHLFLLMATGLGLIGLPSPLPLPPLPEDPALLRVAPADTALFVEWFGGGPPAAQTKNRSEQLAAEPEVRAMVAQLALGCRAMIEQQAGKRPQGQGLLALFDQGIAALQRPGCAFVVQLRPFEGGIVVSMGEHAGALATAFAGALALLEPGRMEVGRSTFGGVEFQTLVLPRDLGTIGWAAIDGYFAVALGEGALKQIAAGLRQQDAGLGGLPALQQLRDGGKVERPVLRTYASVAHLVGQAPFANGLWKALGVAGATAALAESGLEGDGFVSRLQLALPQAEGLLGVLRGQPLSQDDLALVPDDATVALALRADKGRFEQMLLAIVAGLRGQDAQQEWDGSSSKRSSPRGCTCATT
jgi:hypothetical protein